MRGWDIPGVIDVVPPLGIETHANRLERRVLFGGWAVASI